MKKILFSMTVIVLAGLSMVACKQKTAENTQPAENVEKAAAAVAIAPQDVQALVDAEDWDAIPQELLDKMGVKALKSFKEEAKDAQCDNQQYYFGRGASVELDKEGQLTKATADDANAIIIYLTAESVAYGSIAFANEADYNDFVKKTQEKKNAEEGLEFDAQGQEKEGEATPGFEAGKWFFVNFTSDK